MLFSCALQLKTLIVEDTYGDFSGGYTTLDQDEEAPSVKSYLTCCGNYRAAGSRSCSNRDDAWSATPECCSPALNTSSPVPSRISPSSTQR